MSTGHSSELSPSTWESLRQVTGINWDTPVEEYWEKEYTCWECESTFVATIVHPRSERQFCPDCSPTGLDREAERIDAEAEPRSTRWDY